MKTSKLPEKNNKVLVVLSGGMDSTVALAKAREEHSAENVIAVTFNYNSKHNDQENQAAIKICHYYGVQQIMIELPFIGKLFKSDLLKSGGEIPEGHYEDLSMKKTVVPFRNGIMLSIAAGLAESLGCSEIILGNHAGDHAIYPDCRKEFSDHIQKAISSGTWNGVLLQTPFVSMTKAEICSLGAQLEAPLHLTYSCYKGGQYHCGKCGTCVERKEAFRDSGILDPTFYE